MTHDMHGRYLRIARLRFLFGVFFVLLAYVVVVIRLADLTLLQPATDIVAENETDVVQEHPSYAPLRADIVDRNGTLLATSLKVASLYADATLVEDPVALANQIAAILPDKDKKDLVKRLSSKRKFVWLHRDVTPKQEYRLNELGNPALNFEEEERRIYPSGHMMSHILGYTDVDGRGIAGVEKAFDTALLSRTEPLALTIDLRVQHVLRDSLSRSINKFHAKGGMGVVMDVHTGDIVAMVSLPDFDPHYPGKGKSDTRFNRATLGVFEMGSTFKIFSTAAALDNDTVRFSSRFDTRKPLKYGRFTISDYHGENRMLSVPEIFIHSSNIGTARMVETMPKDALRQFYQKLGFFDVVQIDIPERARPLYPSPWRDIHTITTSYGHGIAVTPVHIVRAAAAMVNGGSLVTPHVVAMKEEGNAQDKVRVISDDTSMRIRQLMALTVQKGTGRKAVAEGYDVGGKTGTAEKNVNGRYVEGKVMSSFLAAFPMRDPRYVVMVAVDEPQPIKESFGYVTGGWTAAPVVAEVVSHMAPLYGIVPDFDADGRITQGMEKYLKEGKAVAAQNTH